ncbi:MAG: prepilin-type N-terminal cleavage/methylation domain-containing protein [Deltaproteobacteria bacterium]|nr:prepilin-type N-terminal cleavage/methylation domain-containing protein [Deltaproteobacteria bacterium]
MTTPLTGLGNGRASKSTGFTLIEVVIVMTIIGALAAIAVPAYQNSVVKAKEAVLKEDLYAMRDAIDKFYSDNGLYPEGLPELVKRRYLRFIPVDPFTNSKDTWVEVYDELEAGVYDVKSRSALISRGNGPYGEW